MRGTTAAYNSLLNSAIKPNDDTLYFISDPGSTEATLYLGSKLIAGGDTDIVIGFENIVDISLSDELKDKSFLIYDKGTGLWTDSTIENALSVFIGATQHSAGISGLVPAPELGKTNLYLRSDGTWAEVAAEPNIFSIENESNLQHTNIINSATQDIILAPGDILVIKDIIYGDKYKHTAYVYNGSTWVAMDGNYNAENVYFDEDFIFTKDVGTITIPSSGSTTVSAKGKNIKEFLSTVFAEELNPTTTQPWITIYSNTAKPYEVGTYVQPYYLITFYPGSYTYGPDTGVTAMGYRVTDSEGKISTSKNGYMPSIQVADTTNYTLIATATHSAGLVPVTNIGNEYDDGAITSGTTDPVTSSAITGFRYVFAGADNSSEPLTSDFIRENLLKIGASTKGHTVTWKAENLAGMKRFIVAIPSDSGRKITNATITSSMNADATADYIKQSTTVNIEGANGYMAVPYDIWIYEPASIASTEVHQITIG